MATVTSTRKSLWLFMLAGTLVVGALLAGSACRGQQAEARAPEYTPTATIKDLMLSIVDPSADVVWESVATVVDESGVEERAPTTDEEWDEVRRGAIRLAEAANLLMMPGRHVARPGERSEAPGVELEPEEMEALINNDRETWNRLAKGLHQAGLDVLQAIDAKDAAAVFDVGERIEMACEACHSTYWYPNQVLPPGYQQ